MNTNKLCSLWLASIFGVCSVFAMDVERHLQMVNWQEGDGPIVLNAHNRLPAINVRTATVSDSLDEIVANNFLISPHMTDIVFVELDEMLTNYIFKFPYYRNTTITQAINVVTNGAYNAPNHVDLQLSRLFAQKLGHEAFYELEVVDQNIFAFMKTLQDNGAIIVGFTSRASAYAPETKTSFMNLGFDFGALSSMNGVQFSLGNDSLFKDGIFYTNGGQNTFAQFAPYLIAKICHHLQDFHAVNVNVIASHTKEIVDFTTPIFGVDTRSDDLFLPDMIIRPTFYTPIQNYREELKKNPVHCLNEIRELYRNFLEHTHREIRIERQIVIKIEHHN